VNVRFVGWGATGRALVLSCLVAVATAACAKDREDAAATGRPVDWDGPDVVRVAVPSEAPTAERYVKPGRRIARGVCVFGSTSRPSGKPGIVVRDWLLAYDGRSCRALMARAAAP
jgi:hypothetical protein